MVQIDKNVNNASYYQRLQQMQFQRMQTGQYGDIRDLPMFTAQGRAMQAQALWEQMGGQGSLANAQYTAQANQAKLDMASIKSTVDGVGQLAKTVMEIINMFKTK